MGPIAAFANAAEALLELTPAFAKLIQSLIDADEEAEMQAQLLMQRKIADAKARVKFGGYPREAGQ